MHRDASGALYKNIVKYLAWTGASPFKQSSAATRRSFFLDNLGAVLFWVLGRDCCRGCYSKSYYSYDSIILLLLNSGASLHFLLNCIVFGTNQSAIASFPPTHHFPISGTFIRYSVIDARTHFTDRTLTILQSPSHNLEAVASQPPLVRPIQSPAGYTCPIQNIWKVFILGTNTLVFP